MTSPSISNHLGFKTLCTFFFLHTYQYNILTFEQRNIIISQNNEIINRLNNIKGLNNIKR